MIRATDRLVTICMPINGLSVVARSSSSEG